MHILCVQDSRSLILYDDLNFHIGSLKWYSRLYRNQGKLLFGPPPLDWGEQGVVITGGATLSHDLAVFAHNNQGRRELENFLRIPLLLETSLLLSWTSNLSSRKTVRLPITPSFLILTFFR